MNFNERTEIILKPSFEIKNKMGGQQSYGQKTNTAVETRALSNLKIVGTSFSE